MENRNTPFMIGDVKVNGRIALGPMAGITDKTFRNICLDMGCSLLYTEMVSAKGLYYNNDNTHDLLKTAENEHPVGLQLFGSDPEIMGDMTGKVKDYPFDFIDINAGCPVPKVAGNGEGSALMKDLPLLGRIVENMVKKAGKPVTVKMRKGFDTENAVEAAKVCEAAGASAICVHGRLRTEYYAGEADWDVIRRVKEAVSVPVIGSGDVRTPQDALNMLDSTGVDCVMIARAARGNPWLFKQCKTYLETGEIIPGPGLDEIKKMIIRHAEGMIEDKGEFIAMNEIRAHVAWYFKGRPNSSVLRGSICRIKSMETLRELLDEYTGKIT